MIGSIQNGYGSFDPSVQNPLTTSVSSSPAGSASANYARISMLVIGEGTNIVAQNVLQSLYDKLTLEGALEQKSHHMQSLLNRNIISMTQIEILYPENHALVKKEDIDLTLWVILLRHITINAKSINKKWTEDPQFWQRQYWHDIQRLKKIRNKLAHNGKAELEDESFKMIWKASETVLMRLGVSVSTINSYLTTS